MKQTKMFIAILLFVALLMLTQAFAAPSSKGKPGGDTKTTTINYVALGDSIADGMGATNYYGYVDLYRDFLTTNGTKVDLKNKSIPGIKTGDLLFQLNGILLFVMQ